jgi:hypothetical protein
MRNAKCEMRNAKFGLLTSALLLLISPFTAKADLTAEVLPGYTFSTGEGPTIAKLNRLGLPSIRISGSISGTNVSITAGSITGTMLADSTVDDTTIYFNGSRQIAIKAYGVGTNVVSTNLAGFGLTGGGGAALGLAYNTNIFGVNNNTNNNVGTNGLGLADSFSLALSNVFWQTTNTFTSTNITIAAGNMLDMPHGLGSYGTNALGFTPRNVRWVLVCTTTDLNYSIGDEIPIEQVVGLAGGTYGYPIFTGGANTTNVFLTRHISSSPTFVMAVNSKGVEVIQILTQAYWKAKVYVRP